MPYNNSGLQSFAAEAHRIVFRPPKQNRSTSCVVPRIIGQTAGSADGTKPWRRLRLPDECVEVRQAGGAREDRGRAGSHRRISSATPMAPMRCTEVPTWPPSAIRSATSQSTTGRYLHARPDKSSALSERRCGAVDERQRSSATFIQTGATRNAYAKAPGPVR
jgi:hypothetical protein